MVILFLFGLVVVLDYLKTENKAKREAAAAAGQVRLEELNAEARARDGYRERKLALLDRIAGRLDHVESRVDALEKRHDSGKTLDWA